MPIETYPTKRRGRPPKALRALVNPSEDIFSGEHDLIDLEPTETAAEANERRVLEDLEFKIDFMNRYNLRSDYHDYS